MHALILSCNGADSKKNILSKLCHFFLKFFFFSFFFFGGGGDNPKKNCEVHKSNCITFDFESMEVGAVPF